MSLYAIAGKPFLDFSLVALESKQEMRLSDLVKKAGVRPLILNFGSCSWPPFMEKLGAFEAIADKEFSDLWIKFPQFISIAIHFYLAQPLDEITQPLQQINMKAALRFLQKVH